MTEPLPPGIAQTVAEAFVRAREALRPHDRAAADEALTSLLDGHEAAASALIGPLLRPLLDHPDIAAEIKQLIAVGVQPEQANELTVVLMIVGALIFPLVQSFLAPAADAVRYTAYAIPGNDITPLPPAEIALGVVRNTLGPIDPYTEGAKWGFSPNRMDVLCRNTGDVPALQELLLLLRRKQITDARFVEGLHLGRLRDDWITEARDLAYGPPSAPEVLAGRIEGFLDDATAQRLFGEAGLNPANYEWMLHTAGRPPGAQELLQLFNRGLIAEDSTDPNVPSVKGAIRESNIKDKYIDPIFQTRVYLPPVRSIPTMLRHNSITEARARELLADHGVQPLDIDGYVKEANSTRTTAQKELSAAQATKAYEYRLITKTELETRVAAHGFSAADAQLFADIADAARHDRFVQAAVNRVHNLYVNHKIDRVTASTLMDADQIPAPARDDWLILWDHERAANVRNLSEAQLAGGLHRGTISDAQFIAGVVTLGYPRADVIVLASLAFPPTRQPANLATRFG